MRISTSMIHSNALSGMARSQSALLDVQTELSTGKKINKPSDDPVAAVRILQLRQEKASSEQFGTNISALETRLTLGEQALSDAENVIQQVSQLAVQANNSTLSDADRQSLATQLTELNKQLVSIANTKDANGEYLFSGFSTGVQPFARDSAGNVSYSGDLGVRKLQVSSSQYMDDMNTGEEVFMSVPEGNGLFVLGANAGNTGSGTITGQVQNRANWTGGDYTLTFTSATDWQVTDSSNAVVGSGTGYTAGDAITFNGVSLSVNGSPAANDSFSISASGTKDIFSTIDDLISTLTSATDTEAQQAQYQTALNALTTQVAQAETRILNITSSIGARSATLESIDSTRQDNIDQLKTGISGLEDSDYTEAAARYAQLYTAYQAAQQSYATISKLSLFDYI